MKMIQYELITLLTLSFSPLALALKIGDPIPASVKSLKLANVQGSEMSLAELKGEKGTLIIFSCNTCPYVKAWEDRIVTIGNEVKAQGFAVAVINSNDSRRDGESFIEMQKRAKDKKFEDLPYLADATSTVAKSFDALKTPEVFLFNKTGKLAYHGAIDDSPDDATKVKEPYLHNALTALKSGTLPKLQETKSVGCGIKFAK